MTDDILALENQLCFAVVTAARNVVAVYRPVLEPLGLTHPQYLVMLALVGAVRPVRSASSPPSSRWSRRPCLRWSSASRRRDA